MSVIDEETRRFGRVLHYIGALATVVGATAGYSLLHAPTVQANATRSHIIEELTLSLRNAPVVRDQHRKVSQKLEQVTERIAAAHRRVPFQANAGAFLQEVTEVATAEQFSIKDFAPGRPQLRRGYAEMEVTLKGEGSFASICRFIDRLTRLKRLSKVKNLSLSAGDSSAAYPMTATLVIYFGLQEEVAKPAREGRRG